MVDSKNLHLAPHPSALKSRSKSDTSLSTTVPRTDNGRQVRKSIDSNEFLDFNIISFDAPASDVIVQNNKVSDLNDHNTGHDAQEDLCIEHVIGSFGWFQLCVLLFSGLREATLSYDAVIMSVILQPETDFSCVDARAQLEMYNHANRSISSLVAPDQVLCYAGSWTDSDMNATHMIECNRWRFEHNSMVARWSLVCHRIWIVAAIETAFFLGMLFGNLAWGYTADNFGRRRAYLISHLLALSAGVVSLFVPDVWMLVVCRFFIAFGNMGNYVICSLQMELIGTKYRSFGTMLYHVGWGVGLVTVPIVYHLFDNYRMLQSVTPIVLLILIPYALWLPESPRWLMASMGDFGGARKQLIRAAKFNGRQVDAQLEKQISMLEQRIKAEARERKRLKNNGVDETDDDARVQQESYSTLVTNRTYLKDTLILSYLATLASLYYFYLNIDFAYVKNLSLEANFISGGVSEWFVCLLGATLLKFMRRKTLAIIFVVVLALSFVAQAFIDLYSVESPLMEFIVTTNNATGTVASVSIIFVVLIASQEVYPTTLRQRGSSIVNTMTGFGSCLAPLLMQYTHLIDDWRWNFVLVAPCVLGAFATNFLTVTDDSDLQDN